MHLPINKSHFHFLLLIAVFIGVLFSPEPALAQTHVDNCPSFSSGTKGVEFGMILERVVGCTELALGKTLAAFVLNDLRGKLAFLTFAMVTLAIAIFGVKMQLGMIRSIKTEGLVLALKIVLVVHFLDKLDVYYPQLLNISKELMGIVSNSLVTSTLSCPTSIDSGLQIWSNIDCLMSGMFGFDTDGYMSAGASLTLASGIIGYITAASVSGYVGTYIAFAGFMFILAFLFAVLRAAYIYISAIIALTFIISLAPLMMPFALFNYPGGRFEGSYFMKWVGQISYFMMQPVILVAFLTLMVSVYDTVLYTSDHSLAAAILGEPVSGPKDFTMDALAEKGIISEESVARFSIQMPQFQNQVNGGSGIVDTMGFLKGNERGKDLTDPGKSFGTFNMDMLNPDMMDQIVAEVGTSDNSDVISDFLANAYMQDVVFALIIMLLISMMFYYMLDFVGDISRYLSGRVFIATLYSEMPMPGESALMGGVGGRVGGQYGNAGGIAGARQQALATAPMGAANAEELRGIMNAGGQGFVQGFTPSSIMQGYNMGIQETQLPENTAQSGTDQPNTAGTPPATNTGSTVQQTNQANTNNGPAQANAAEPIVNAAVQAAESAVTGVPPTSTAGVAQNIANAAATGSGANVAAKPFESIINKGSDFFRKLIGGKSGDGTAN